MIAEGKYLGLSTRRVLRFWADDVSTSPFGFSESFSNGTVLIGKDRAMWFSFGFLSCTAWDPGVSSGVRGTVPTRMISVSRAS